jgi:hypothetical protein
MVNTDDPSYIIAENGFYYVASRHAEPGTYNAAVVTVSAKGVANGLSEEYNDGFLFGPDTYDPTSTANPPYTQTSGIQEAINYVYEIAKNNYFYTGYPTPTYRITYNIPKIILREGMYNVYNAISIPITYTDPDGYWVWAMPSIVGSGPRSTMIRDQTSNGLVYIITTTQSSGNFISNQEFGQIEPAQISGFSVISNNLTTVEPSPSTATQYGIYIDIGDSPAHLSLFDLDIFGNFQTRGLYCSVDDSSIHNIGLSSFTPSTIFATFHSKGGFLSVSGLKSSGWGYGNIELIGNEIHVSDSLLTSVTIGNDIAGMVTVVLDDIWFGNNWTPSSDVPGLININANIQTLKIINTHLQGQATSTTAANSPPIFYLGFSASSREFDYLYIRSSRMYADQLVSGAVTMLSRDTNGNEWLTNKFKVIDAVTSSSGLGISTTEFEQINGKWIGIPTIPTNPPASGTVYQNTNPYDIEIDLPVYASTSGTSGTIEIYKGATSTPDSIGTEFVSGGTSSSAVHIAHVRVPAGWYFEFVGSGVTIGTAVVSAV